MAELNVDDRVLVCERCGNGREVCTFCKGQDWTVFKTICDCGLFRVGYHTIPCSIVLDEAAHTALGAHPVTDAEAEHGGHVMPSEGEWTDADDEALQELLDDD